MPSFHAVPIHRVIHPVAAITALTTTYNHVVWHICHSNSSVLVRSPVRSVRTLLVVRPGAPSSFLLLLVRHLLLEAMHLFLVASERS